MRSWRILLLLIAGSLLVCRPLPAQTSLEIIEEEQGPVRGVVRDAATGREIADARVTLSALSSGLLGSDNTNSGGEFTLDGIPRGAYTLTVEHPDYLPLRQQLTTDGRVSFGLQLALRKKPAVPGASPANPAPPEAPPAPPARATGIPRAAQDAMNQGMDLLYVKSDARGSIGQFERAIREYPGFYEAYTQVGAARTALGNSAEAAQAFRKAIELSEGKYVDAYAGLAGVLSNDKHFPDAEAAARKVIELSPDDWRGQAELARALHGQERYQDAEAPAGRQTGAGQSDPATDALEHPSATEEAPGHAGRPGRLSQARTCGAGSRPHARAARQGAAGDCRRSAGAVTVEAAHAHRLPSPVRSPQWV